MSTDTSIPLISTLRRAMPDSLARFAAGLVGPDDTRPAIGIDQLMDVAVLATSTFRRRTAGPVDPRAAVSVWTLMYFETVLPAVLSAIILLERMPCVEIDQVRFIVGPKRDVAALKVFGERLLPPQASLQMLMTVHLSPLIETIASCGGVTRRVLWSNAGHIIEAFLGMIEYAAAETEGLACARALLASSHSSGGSPNPLFRPVRYVGGKRVRRVCCLRFLTPGWTICAICPVAENNPARARRTLSQAR